MRCARACSICCLFPGNVCAGMHYRWGLPDWLQAYAFNHTDVMVRIIRFQYGEDPVDNLFWSSVQQQLSCKEGERQMPEDTAMIVHINEFLQGGCNCVRALHMLQANHIQHLLLSGFLTSEWVVHLLGDGFSNGKHVSLHLTAQMYAFNKRFRLLSW